MTNPNIKSYSFFTPLPPITDLQTSTNRKYPLTDITITDMKIHNSHLYLNAKIKKQVPTGGNILIPVLFKTFTNTILTEYTNIYNKTLHSFHIRTLPNTTTTFLFTLGNDFKEITIGNDKTFLLINSIKIINLTPNPTTNVNINETSLLRTMNLMRYSNDNYKIWNSNDFIHSIEPITNILCFNISDNGNYAAVGLEKGEVLLLYDLLQFNAIKHKIVLLPKSTNDNVTNVLFVYNRNGDCLLVYSTLQDIFYFSLTTQQTIAMNVGWGCLMNSMLPYTNTSTTNKELLFMIMSPIDYSIFDFDINLDKGASWLFEGKKSNLHIYKECLVFITNNNNNNNGASSSSTTANTIVVYDKVNKFYINNTTLPNSKVNACTVDPKQHTIYILIEHTDNKHIKELLIYKEISSYEKLNCFYNKNDYTTAISYAKSYPLNYSDVSLSNIYKQHGDYLYSKSDFKKAIDEYIKSLPHIEPSFIISLFMDVSKINYLITYLEALITYSSSLPHSNTTKLYIKLLLNCYIKQKRFNKFTHFITSIAVNKDKHFIIKNAIDICKESNQIELAYDIAEKTKLNAVLIDILIEMKHDYYSAIALLSQEKNILFQYDVIIKHGSLLLQAFPKEFMVLIKEVTLHFINIQNGIEQFVTKIKDFNVNVKHNDYLQMLTVFINKDEYYEEYIDFILEKEVQYKQEIIHRKIELLLMKYNNSDNSTHTQKEQCTLEIMKYIKNKKILNVIDMNYMLFLFKTNKFINGIVLLCEITEQKVELLQIYMDTNQYDKIIEICDVYGDDDKNIYIQSLNYFIDKYENDNDCCEYIYTMLMKMNNKNLISSIMLVEIAKKMKGKLKFAMLKELIHGMLMKKIKEVEGDKKERDAKFDKLDKIKKEIVMLANKKVVNVKNECDLCRKEIKNEHNVIAFVCLHCYHQKCVGEYLEQHRKGKDYDEEIECPQCLNKNNQLTQRMRQSEEQSNDHNNFFMELKSRSKRFDLITKYLGKGIFKLEEE